MPGAAGLVCARVSRSAGGQSKGDQGRAVWPDCREKKNPA